MLQWLIVLPGIKAVQDSQNKYPYSNTRSICVHCSEQSWATVWCGVEWTTQHVNAILVTYVAGLGCNTCGDAGAFYLIHIPPTENVAISPVLSRTGRQVHMINV